MIENTELTNDMEEYPCGITSSIILVPAGDIDKNPCKKPELA
jgi:hypothetical protein